MAVSRKKRQRKIEQKKAKRKAKRSVLVKQKQAGFAERLADALNAPLHHCFLTVEFEDRGIGQLLVSRRLPDGWIAYAVFLIDLRCLGVKDSFAGIISPRMYSDRFDEWIFERAEEIDPADARKLVEEAVEYARGIGFSPRGEFRKAMAIFQAVDANEAARRFEFGKDGKPFYINGPHESKADILRIQNMLEKNCGPGGYETMIMLDEHSIEWFEDEFEVIDEMD